MSKLDGNERWKTKMLLTEHKEQYEQKEKLKLSGRPTTEEHTMMLGVIVFPHLLVMLQKSLDDIGFAHVALKGVIIRCLEHIMFAASNDLFKLKKELKVRNIRIVEEETSEDVLFYRYFCRGYDERFGIVREVLRTEIQIRLTEYTKDLGQQLKSRS